ncbi:hypothetical protein L211DRAFT_839524 [Terfezia boudieri ATCC MYA-4762]|uniref:Uncharacterized protein n=1 Tax=Terfezia boudieri ATCC MYA-4762 TaxID=1051890 RepID=A0A3N4LHV8_9PEZI|nr:hypothetical protein L211DRAFT_839524 [Terfezia boudieri ATCC MYA-4762]
MPRPTKQKRACRAATLASQIARQRENHTELELLELEDLEEDILEVQGLYKSKMLCKSMFTTRT